MLAKKIGDELVKEDRMQVYIKHLYLLSIKTYTMTQFIMDLAMVL